MLAELLMIASMEITCPAGGIPLDVVVRANEAIGTHLVDLVDMPKGSAADQILVLRRADGAVVIAGVAGNCVDSVGLHITRNKGRQV